MLHRLVGADAVLAVIEPPLATQSLRISPAVVSASASWPGMAAS